MAVTVTINGETRHLGVRERFELLTGMGLDPAKIAVERNLEIVPRSQYGVTAVEDGDRTRDCPFHRRRQCRPDLGKDKPFVIAGRSFRSRLIVGTGKYKTYAAERRSAGGERGGDRHGSGAPCESHRSEPGRACRFHRPQEIHLSAEYGGLFHGEDAVRTLRLAREAGGWTLVKLEVLGDKKTLYPNMIETLHATELLLKEGFQVMVYCSDDPLMAKRLEELGACAIMPLAAPIGSGLGVQNPVGIRMIIEEANVPVIVDAGVGTASDAAVAMELGCDAVLMNTAIAEAKDPVMMASAMKHAVEAGRLAYLAGRMAKKRYADPSSPLAGLI